jgi:hypothetical protein
MIRNTLSIALAASAAAVLAPVEVEAQAGQTAPSPAAVAPGASGLPAVDPNDPWLWGDVAELRGLDKVTAATRDFLAPVGEDVQFFALTVSVKRCAKRPPERTPEVIVGMEVYDRQTDGSGEAAASARVFSGWMFGSSPALNPLEHPVYDIWVLDCVNSQDPVQAQALVEDETPEPPRLVPPADNPLPGEVFD